MSSARDRAIACFLLTLGFLFLAWIPGAVADTIIQGWVTDATTGGTLAGAEVSICRGNEVLNRDSTDADGRFRLPFNVGVRPEAQNLKLFIRRNGYAEASKDVVVVSGRADSPSYRFDLLPSAIVGCRRNRDHAVVVGYFRPPVSTSGELDLASRVADALSYDLLTRIQQQHLKPGVQPIVLVCGQARPQATTDYPNFAKALRADAFVSGYVSPSGTKYKVDMCVADRFDLLVPPPRVSSRDVNLDDPAATRLAPEVHKAILTALIAGYRETKKYAECVDVTVAAERILGSLPPQIEEARRECQAALRNRGLLPGGQP